MQYMKLVVIGLVLVGSAAFARGWECEQTENGPLVVREYDSLRATKNPAVLLVVKDGELAYIAKGAEISKDIVKKEDSEFPGTKLDNVKYSSDEGRNEESVLAVEAVALTINGNPDSEKLKNGQRRAGRLVITNGRGDNAPVAMDCYYYLKGERAKEVKE